MLDFVTIKRRENKNTIVVYPEFKIKKTKDLMIRGKSFYAIWNENKGFWSTDEYDVQNIVDLMIYNYVDNNVFDKPVEVKLMADFSSNVWLDWQKYCKSLGNNYVELDDIPTFDNSPKSKDSYISKSLPYALIEQDTKAYDELSKTLYDEDELAKLEWAIGSIIAGDSKNIQKFIVLYGAPGSGKSTMLNIFQKMFQGYWVPFESMELTKANNPFALEMFRSNPLIAIEHDGDLSRIENNARLNSIVSHESITINEKFKAPYASTFKTFLFIGTNKPVKITDAKSGIIRRLIDVSPSGRKVPKKRFDKLIKDIEFEFGGIASKCLNRYKSMGSTYYDGYIPMSMIGATNDFYNFIEDNYDFFADDQNEGVSLSSAWALYKDYCEDARVPYPMPRRLFKEEMRNYFFKFEDRVGNRRSVFYEFKKELIFSCRSKDEESVFVDWLKMESDVSLFDSVCSDYPAQYSVGKNETPELKWVECKSKLKDLDTRKEHYVIPDGRLIVIDFDLKNENGEKDRYLNLKEASKWPETYAEYSRGGQGIHLHYWFDGDCSKLSRIIKQDIEVKIFTGNASLRRKLSKCNDLPISSISSGLPLKEIKMITEKTIKNEEHLRNLIKKNLNKEIHGFTKPSIDFIVELLDNAYEQGVKYDVRDMIPAIQNFAMNSSHNAEYCLKSIGKMKLVSEESSEDIPFRADAPIVFFDIEIFPNLFIVVYKKIGEESKPVVMINPNHAQIEEIIQYKLVGFNNRKYDNHILYAAMMGYSIPQLYRLSNQIINDKERNHLFGEAYNLSYTDILDFLNAGNKKSLKKWEIELGIHHQELGFRWDEPVPEEHWLTVAQYCKNDVIATEAVWNAAQEDWIARLVLAEWADLTPNDTTNNCTTKIIVGNDKEPQNQFVYTDLSTIFPGYEFSKFGIDKDKYNNGTKIVSGKSIYLGEDPGEGGYVYAEPGIYHNVAVLDVASMHPTSAILLNIFGDKYTERFANIVKARIMIKHKDFEGAKTILPTKLHKYLEDPGEAKKLANALKTAINSVYGLTSARFQNKLKDPRNIDNIVAKRGALFMINLKYAVQELGYKVIHIKTDSIKIANADDIIVEFVNNYGKEFGYTFEYECKYSRICLVNESTYIAKVCEEEGKIVESYWTATGTQFQIPYVFKRLFSKEKVEFSDMCETKSVTTALYLDFNESLEEGKHDYVFVGKVGSFCPVIDGTGGGILLRQDEKDQNKFSAVVGTKKNTKDVYRWMETEMIKNLYLQDKIDVSYYNRLVDDAIDTISKFGDFEMFVSGEFLDMNIPEDVDELVPFDEFPMPIPA